LKRIYRFITHNNCLRKSIEMSQRFNKASALAAIIILILFLSSSRPLNSVNSYRWPVELPKSLSGTLGERRGTRFHFGIDIKTLGRNGHPVFATATGRLYRIVSWDRGYGNALQIAHGNTHSFYAHLQKYEDFKHRIHSLVELLKTIYVGGKIDFKFFTSAPLYQRGDIIGYTGESGAGYPHLHFEFRKGNGTINPLKFFRIKDADSPVIDSLFLCIEKENTTIHERRIPLIVQSGRYRSEIDPIPVSPSDRLFFKISCYDRIGAENKVAVHRLQLFEENRKIFEISFDSLRWIDYRKGYLIYDISKSFLDGEFTYTYFLCRRTKNTFSGIAPSGNGYVTIPRGKKNYTVAVFDYAGNISVMTFSLIGDTSVSHHDDFVPINRSRHFSTWNKTREIAVAMRPYSLNHNALIRITDRIPKAIEHSLEKTFSLNRYDIQKIYALHPFDSLYRRPVQVTIKRPRGLTPAEAKNIFLYNFFEGEFPSSCPTTYDPKKDRFIAWTKTNGYFALIRDREPPAVSIPPTHEFVEDDALYRIIRFHIRDNLAGVDLRSVSCFIDGEAYPFRYDSDRRWLELKLSRAAVSEGLHHVLILCKDNSDNRSEFRGLFGF